MLNCGSILWQTLQQGYLPGERLHISKEAEGLSFHCGKNVLMVQAGLHAYFDNQAQCSVRKF